MSFFRDFTVLDEDLSQFPSKTTTNVCVERNYDEKIPQKVFRCSVCRSRFIYLSSFIKSCKNHQSDLKFDLSDDVVVKVESCFEDNGNLSESDDETSCSSGSASNQSSDEDVKKVCKSSKETKSKRKKSRNACVLPPGHVFICKLCDKTFVRRQTYRDHVLGHENPLIKCCKICVTQFSSGIIASKHKKKFHPELYREEMRQRAAERAKNGRKKTIYHTIAQNFTNGEISQTKDFKIVLEHVYLPGFLRNDWIYLPKKKEEYPWITEKKIKNESNSKNITKPTVKDEEEESEQEQTMIDDDDFEDTLLVKIESPVQVETEKIEEVTQFFLNFHLNHLFDYEN